MNYELYDTIVNDDIKHITYALKRFKSDYNYEYIIIDNIDLNDDTQLYTFNVLEAAAQITHMPIYFDMTLIEYFQIRRQLNLFHQVKKFTYYHKLFFADNCFNLSLFELSEGLLARAQKTYHVYDCIYDDIYQLYYNKPKRNED